MNKEDDERTRQSNLVAALEDCDVVRRSAFGDERRQHSSKPFAESPVEVMSDLEPKVRPSARLKIVFSSFYLR